MLRTHQQIVVTTRCDGNLVQEAPIQDATGQVLLGAITKQIDERDTVRT